MDHLISIIIPVYNVENLLPLTLNTVYINDKSIKGQDNYILINKKL